MATPLLQLVVFHMHVNYIRVSDHVPQMPFCQTRLLAASIFKVLQAVECLLHRFFGPGVYLCYGP